jgi:hypothetical protein
VLRDWLVGIEKETSQHEVAWQLHAFMTALLRVLVEYLDDILSAVRSEGDCAVASC